MIFNNRIQTVGTVGEFMNGVDTRAIKRAVKRFNKGTRDFKASISTLAAGAIAVTITNKMFSGVAYAQEAIPVISIPGSDYVKGAAKEKIIEAFMPLVDMIQALSYPIALVMLTGGALMFMINQKDRGLGLIQNASIGYILVQLMPMMMQLLVGIGSTVAFGLLVII
ncbi:hypothetical protein [Alkalihalophilus marmarensis]|uniref:hypothetical protein n=1 Tax=Alkalihalophilus marmarensis TaxID=521377 RepID=UPI002E24E700|nr:hypothetical protein [Alkalihalophilus marmarensis]